MCVHTHKHICTLHCRVTWMRKSTFSRIFFFVSFAASKGGIKTSLVPFFRFSAPGQLDNGTWTWRRRWINILSWNVNGIDKQAGLCVSVGGFSSSSPSSQWGVNIYTVVHIEKKGKAFLWQIPTAFPMIQLPSYLSIDRSILFHDFEPNVISGVRFRGTRVDIYPGQTKSKVFKVVHCSSSQHVRK